MAEQDQQSRTEEPTAKRLEEARKRGQVPRSPELTAAAVTLAAGAAMSLLGGSIGGQLSAVMSDGLTISRAELMDERVSLEIVRDLAMHGLLAGLPILGITFVMAMIAPMLLGGWNFSAEALAPKLERISPMAGLGRMFSGRSLMELGKSLAKFAVVATVASIVLWKQAAPLAGLANESIAEGIIHALRITGGALIAMSASLLLIAAIDVPFQLWRHRTDLKMTLEEVHREHRESEGSPEVRGKIRSLQQEIAKRRMMQDVPLASVVVTNPQHYSVALRYLDKKTRAPIVVAKGADEVAAKIREIAREHGVPIFEAPPLARVLFRNVDIGGEIPTALYVAVAQVLSYVIQLKTAKQSGLGLPERPVIDPEIEHIARTRGH